jgi:hypothetical protein
MNYLTYPFIQYIYISIYHMLIDKSEVLVSICMYDVSKYTFYFADKYYLW